MTVAAKSSVIMGIAGLACGWKPKFPLLLLTRYFVVPAMQLLFIGIV